MRKYYALLLVILCIFSLAACNKAEQEGPPYYFIGEVTEIYEADGKFFVKVICFCYRSSYFLPPCTKGQKSCPFGDLIFREPQACGGGRAAGPA